MFVDLELETISERTQHQAQFEGLIIAGWTGRDSAKVEAHIRELEELGVSPPPSTPVYYRASPARLTTQSTIFATGTDSSGEVEAFVARLGGALWVGLGSDHTDRRVETFNVTASKQVCDKPIAPHLWLYEDVKSHWDELLTRSYIMVEGEEVLYQEGPLSAMLPMDDLIERFGNAQTLPENYVMFGGTHAAIGGLKPSTHFRMELEDPVLKRIIAHRYDVRELEDMG